MKRNNKTFSKFVLFLNSYSREELKPLGKFLQSPYYTTNDRVFVLYKELIKKHPNIEEVNKKDLYWKVYPEKKKTGKINEGSLRDLISQLNKLIYEFLMLQQIDKDPTIRQRLHLKMLTQHGKEQKFKECYAMVKANMEDSPVDTHQLYHKYRVEDQAYIFTTLFDNRAANTNLQEMVDTFDNYYLSTKLKYLAVMYNRENIVENKFTYRLQDEVLDYIKSRDLDQLPPTIILYYQLVLLLKNYRDKENFVSLKRSLQKYDQLAVAKMELRQIYTIAINCCRWNILLGRDVQFYAGEAYAFYQLMINGGIIFVDKKIQPSHFRNLVYYSILLKDWKGARSFIEEYKDRLPAEHSAKIISYTKAALFFAQGSVDAAHSCLSDLLEENEFIDVFYHLYLKTLLVQIHFVKKEAAALDSILESFRKYLSRKSEIPALYLKAYKNFLKIVKQKLNPNLENADFFGPLAEREWLRGIVH